MTTYHNGKIARLPKTIRDELKEAGVVLGATTSLVPNSAAVLYNAHPDVQKILADQFEGRPITQQNLSVVALAKGATGHQDPHQRGIESYGMDKREKRRLLLRVRGNPTPTSIHSPA